MCDVEVGYFEVVGGCYDDVGWFDVVVLDVFVVGMV